ncbi:hypothetical protein ABZ345_21650 [Lentzea sp. NPDC005914]|uniref:hypothetical protein n=1 Tax=Lentzea sp. NPDC005914 TaxID=3154572 RepID=UPI0033C1687E
MDNRRVLATTALALSVAVTFSPLATAQQQQPKLEMPATVISGESIRATTGPCETFSAVTSPGFREPIMLSPLGDGSNRLEGFGSATTKAGTYTATVQCDSKTLTAQFTVDALDFNWGLDPAEVEPGGTISIFGSIYSGGGCYGTSQLTSPGFAVPPTLQGGNMGHVSGYTTVVTTPGTYEAIWRCSNRPEGSVRTFRVLGTPPTTTPPASGKPKPPIVKPKGAPDTGGGGTA